MIRCISGSRAPPPLDLKQKVLSNLEMVAKLATISDCIFEDKRWTEPKKYGKISIRNEALKSGADGG